jgi:hypothetical protein
MEPTALSLGNVVFNEKGEPLGLCTLRVGSNGRRRSFDSTDAFLPVIIPPRTCTRSPSRLPRPRT